MCRCTSLKHRLSSVGSLGIRCRRNKPPPERDSTTRKEPIPQFIERYCFSHSSRGLVTLKIRSWSMVWYWTPSSRWLAIFGASGWQLSIWTGIFFPRIQIIMSVWGEILFLFLTILRFSPETMSTPFETISIEQLLTPYYETSITDFRNCSDAVFVMAILIF